MSDLQSQPDFISRMVEIYRDFMYDTMVLYLSVFPEGEISKRDVSINIFNFIVMRLLAGIVSRHLESVDVRYTRKKCGYEKCIHVCTGSFHRI